MRKNRRLSNTAAIALIAIVGFVLIYLIMNVSTGSPGGEGETATQEAAESIDPRAAAVAQAMAGMDDRQKAGQLFLARVPEENQIEDIQNYGLGGYLIFGADVEGESVDSLTAKIQSWQAAAKTPMFIASDEEGGSVTRVSQILEEPFASPGDLYNSGGMEAIISDTLAKSETLKGLGINLNLSPVADVAVDPSSFIYDRTLKLPPETTLEEAAQTTAEYVKDEVEAMKSVGLGCSLKHFPGYGENGDSHTDIIHDTRALDELETIDFIPFKAGIEAGAGGVMITHNIAEAIDPTQPATISPAVHEVLRNELGFNGVILSDDFDMAGLSDFVDQESGAVRTISAGTDLVLSSSYADQIEAVLTALESGEIPRERFEDAVTRVLGWKYDLGLLPAGNTAQ